MYYVCDGDSYTEFRVSSLRAFRYKYTCVCVCVCNFYSKGRPPGLKDRGEGICTSLGLATIFKLSIACL